MSYIASLALCQVFAQTLGCTDVLLHRRGKASAKLSRANKFKGNSQRYVEATTLNHGAASWKKYCFYGCLLLPRPHAEKTNIRNAAVLYNKRTSWRHDSDVELVGPGSHARQAAPMHIPLRPKRRPNATVTQLFEKHFGQSRTF